MSNSGKIKNDLYHLRNRKRNLKERIGQSMHDAGSSGTTSKCKKLQKELSRVVKTEKSKKQKLRKW